MKRFLAIAVLLLNLVALAQTKSPQLSHTPPSPPGETEGREEAIRKCKVADHYLSDDDCIKGLKRWEKARTMGCPDPDAAAACHSFGESLAANDVDLMDDFATKDHVYICFRTKEDVFLTLWFSEPVQLAWQRDAQKSAFTQISGVGLALYKNGIWDGDEVTALGRWETFDPESYATFYGKFESSVSKGEVHIDHTAVTVQESYQNKADSETTHTFTLQRSTGRFTETYQWESLGKTQRKEYSGRCLVL
jgi:hypothetical protein